jgi:fluoroacetyl-CoA thioesterase
METISGAYKTQREARLILASAPFRSTLRRSLEGGSMQPVPIGAKGSFSLIVRPEQLASNFKDAMLPPVLSTPVMIMIMENAALNALKAYLEPGESAVGTRIDVRHLAATPVGKRVTGEAVVTKVEGRRIMFDVSARDETEEIGAGTHERALVNLAKIAERLKAKSAP